MSEQVQRSPRAIQDALLAPFPESSIGWKPQAKTKDGTKALAVPFIDARDVQDRLNEVFGIEGWKDSYVFLADGVLCRLEVWMCSQWIPKEDVGGFSDQPDRGDKLKSAVSDALKRAAVKLGVGRYIYSIDPIWWPYDEQRKAFVGTPTIGARPPANNTPKPQQQATPAPSNEPAKKELTGPELLEAIRKHEAKLVADGICKSGDVQTHVNKHADKFDRPSWEWNPSQVNELRKVAHDKVAEIEAKHKAKA